jgi:hypothetical protein
MYLALFEVKLFAKKWDHFRGGTLTVAPEGDLVFGEKVESPLTLFKRKFTSVQPTRASGMCKRLGNPF